MARKLGLFVRKIITGIILVLAFIPGVFMLAITGTKSTLTCEKIEPSQADCTLRYSWIGLLSTRTETFSDLQGAEVEADCDPECSYRVRLQTEPSRLLLEGSAGWSGNQPQVQAMVDEINGYLADPEAGTLTLSDSLDWLERGVAWLIGLIWLSPIFYVGFKQIRRLLAYLRKAN